MKIIADCKSLSATRDIVTGAFRPSVLHSMHISGDQEGFQVICRILQPLIDLGFCEIRDRKIFADTPAAANLLLSFFSYYMPLDIRHAFSSIVSYNADDPSLLTRHTLDNLLECVLLFSQEQVNQLLHPYKTIDVLMQHKRIYNAIKSRDFSNFFFPILVLRERFDVNFMNPETGLSLLMLALQSNSQEFCFLLQMFGADPVKPDFHKQTSASATAASTSGLFKNLELGRVLPLSVSIKSLAETASGKHLAHSMVVNLNSDDPRLLELFHSVFQPLEKEEICCMTGDHEYLVPDFLRTMLFFDAIKRRKLLSTEQMQAMPCRMLVGPGEIKEQPFSAIFKQVKRFTKDQSLFIQQNKDGFTGLMIRQAAAAGDIEGFLCALAGLFPRVNINEQGGKSGQTALHRAIATGNTLFAILLMELGADPALQDARGLSATDIAKTKGNQDFLGYCQQRRELTRATEGISMDL